MCITSLHFMSLFTLVNISWIFYALISGKSFSFISYTLRVFQAIAWILKDCESLMSIEVPKSEQKKVRSPREKYKQILEFFNATWLSETMLLIHIDIPKRQFHLHKSRKFFAFQQIDSSTEEYITLMDASNSLPICNQPAIPPFPPLNFLR